MRTNSSAPGVGRHGPPRAGDERGSVLLETAIAIPCLVATGIALLWGLGIGITMLTLSDGAYQAARAAARGEPPAVAVSLAARLAPKARVSVDRSGGHVTVALAQEVSVPLPLLEGLEVTVQRSATAAVEELPAW
ncbi:MAG: hypothetical protein KGP12_10015 [Actinomycetales bacterium]|nr:hypothetical protein [Actinomycetales bacterium]